jgi:hypothetical protein
MATTGDITDLNSEKKTENEKTKDENKTKEPTKRELDVVTSVFKSFETGLREGIIFPKVRFLRF